MSFQARRTRLLLSVVIALWAFASCAQDSPDFSVFAAPSDLDFEQGPLSRQGLAVMSGAGTCIDCHGGVADEAGQDFTFDTLWRPTMMSNAARDPYWLATVRTEVESHPGLAEVIEAKCATCHMPMAFVEASVAGESTNILGDGFNNPDHPYADLAAEGVSCVACHQIDARNLGSEESFSGGFVIGDGQRVTYSPFPQDNTLAGVMGGISGYEPVQSDHMRDAALCATCHVLYTPFVDGDGNVAGTFPEQMVYGEWLASNFGAEGSCLECHSPMSTGTINTSSLGGERKGPVYGHTYGSTNLFMTALMAQNAEALGTVASSEQFLAAMEAGAELLGERTATVAIDDAAVEAGRLRFEVAVESMTGHKLPTSFPSRRVWLHVVVADADGATLFESGGYQPNGRIDGNDNDDDASRYEPHYETITDADQVQIYEPILINTDGDVTTGLVRAAGYAKDNRLLPRGFTKAGADPDLGTYGLAATDPNFQGGGDRVSFDIDVGRAVEGPLTIRVDLLYQSVGYRWAINLDDRKQPEVDQFRRMSDGIDNLPALIDSVVVDIAPSP